MAIAQFLLHTLSAYMLIHRYHTDNMHMTDTMWNIGYMYIHVRDSKG